MTRKSVKEVRRQIMSLMRNDQLENVPSISKGTER